MIEKFFSVWYIYLKNKNVEKKEKVLSFLSYAVVISYIFDFFVHEFVYGRLNTDKLPFLICIVLSPIIAFVQFNKKFAKFIDPSTVLAIVGPMLYLCYPVSIGDDEPWCYQAFQIMFYHGALCAW